MQSCFLQCAADTIKQTGFFGTAASEVYQDLACSLRFAEFTNLGFGIFTEKYFCRCVIFKLFHNNSSFAAANAAAVKSS